MLPGEGRWSPQFLGLFLPPPWLGQLPEGPAPRIRLPSRRAETAICLLRSAEFSLSTPSPAPQRRPTPGPRPCRTRRFPRTRALCLQPWEGPGPPETAPGLGGRSGCAGRRLSRASPSQAARASAASPRGPALPPAGGPRSGTRGTGVCSNSPRLRDARYAPRAVRPEPLSVAPEPATRARDPGEAGRDRTGHFRRLRAAIAPPLPASATRVGRAGSRKELHGAGRGRRGGAVSGPGWRVRLLGLSRGGSLRRDAPKPVPRSHGAGRPGRGADGAARAAAGPVGAAAGGGGLGPGGLRRVGAAAAARLPPRAAAPAGAVCRRECQAGGARVVVAARPSWEDSGPGLWGRQDCKDCVCWGHLCYNLFCERASASLGPDSLGLQVLAAHRCGLRPAVGYELNPWLVGLARLRAWRAGCAGSVRYHREDLWKLPLLEDKLQAELPAGARVVSGRFPLPTWQPVAVVGEGLDRVWAYDIHRGGPAGQAVPGPSSASILGTPNSQNG
nr:protein FAM173A isoform X2 [Bubalus bubalis]